MRATVVLVILFAFLASASSALGRTTVVHWSPFTSDGSLRSGLVATPKYHGDCWTGSFVLHRGYRCMTGNRIYDPCFGDPNRDDAVVCAQDPFARGVIRLRVSGDFSDIGSAPAGTPWALRLRSGEKCSLQAGGTHEIDPQDRAANYYCRRSNVVLWGLPSKGPTRHIYMSHSYLPGPETVATIRTVYIGSG